MANALAGEWRFGPHVSVWPPAVVIDVLRALWRHGADRAFCGQWLQQMVDRTVKYQGDASSRVSDRDRLCDALIEFGDVDQAKSLLRDAVRLSAGIGYRKDHQMNAWLDWARDANRSDSTAADGRIRFLLRGVLSLRDSTEGPAAYDAAGKLVTLAYDRSPRLAVQIVHLLAEGGTLGWPDGVNEFLHQAAKDSRADIALTAALIQYMLMPISRDGAGELCRHVISRTQSPEQAKAICTSFRQAALTFAPLIARKKWLNAIDATCADLGIALSVTGACSLPQSESETEDGRHTLNLRLTSGEELASDAALERITDVRQFLWLLSTSRRTGITFLGRSGSPLGLRPGRFSRLGNSLRACGNSMPIRAFRLHAWSGWLSLPLVSLNSPLQQSLFVNRMQVGGIGGGRVAQRHVWHGLWLKSIRKLPFRFCSTSWQAIFCLVEVARTR